MTLDPLLLDVLACPIDKGPLLWFEDEDVLYNPRLKKSYAVVDGVPVTCSSTRLAADASDAEHARLSEKAEKRCGPRDRSREGELNGSGPDTLGLWEATARQPERVSQALDAAGRALEEVCSSPRSIVRAINSDRGRSGRHRRSRGRRSATPHSVCADLGGRRSIAAGVRRLGHPRVGRVVLGKQLDDRRRCRRSVRQGFACCGDRSRRSPGNVWRSFRRALSDRSLGSCGQKRVGARDDLHTGGTQQGGKRARP